MEIEKKEKETEAEAADATKVDSAVRNGNGNGEQTHSNPLGVYGDNVGKSETKGDGATAAVPPVPGVRYRPRGSCI